MKKLCVFFGIMLLLVANSYSEETKTFAGSRSYFNYSIDYPSNWQANDIYGLAQIVSPLESKSDDFRENIVIMIADFSKKPKSLEEFNDLIISKIIPQELSGFTLLDQGKTVIDGKETLFYTYKGTKGTRNLKYKRYTLKNNTSIYELTFEAKEDDFDKYLSQAEKIIKSIKVKK